MSNEHPITPPPELVRQLIDLPLSEEERLAAAYRAGANQQLKECVDWLDGYEPEGWAAEMMRAACRPKPPSLKELALASVKRFEESGEFFSDQMRELEFIRKALEQLDD